MKPKLIITAHDFGLCKSVNAGIEFLLKQKNNVFTELEILPNAPGSDEAVLIAKKYDISVSLCLNLTTFKPLSQNANSLIENNQFKSVTIEDWDFSVINTYNEDEVIEEINAQWQWFLDQFGRKPTAILSRKNETGDPKILMPVVELAKAQSVPMRTPVWKWRSNYAAQSYANQEGVKCTSNIYVYPSLNRKWGLDIVEDLDKIVEECQSNPGISEAVILVGFVDEELFTLSSLNWERGIFLQLMQNNSLYNKLTSCFDLVSYQDLK